MDRRSVLLAGAALALGACAASETHVEAAPVPSPQPPAPVPPPSGERYGFDIGLYQRIAGQPGNQFVSPYSVSAAFSLLYPGARNATAGEIASTFGFDANATAASARARALADALRTQTGGSECTLANAAWVERSMELNAAYARSLSDELGGTIEAVDFIRNQRAALARINVWAARETHDRIREILTEPDPARRLVLTNAIYFKGKWSAPFRANSTHDGQFRLAGGGTSPARLMRQVTRARYFEADTFQAAQFDYDAGAFALAVFLPKESSNVAAFDRALSGARIGEWVGRLNNAEAVRLDVTLPKVTVNSSYELSRPLIDMGLRTSFTDGADFSGVTAQERLAISAVVHKTFLAIDEDGTEAAAVTAIDMRATSAMRPPEDPPIEFKADRPFFIALHHKPTGALLFLGRISTTA